MTKISTGKFTPEEKAEMQQNRTLSDARLIMAGAHYAPDFNGEPILVLTEKQTRRESNDSPDLIKIFEQIRPGYSEDITWGNDNRGNKISIWIIKKGIEIFEKKWSYVHAYDYKQDRSSYCCTRVLLIDDGVPYICIQRESGNNIYGGRCRNTDCYSLKEFYDNLAENEKEEGEKLGKKLEGYLLKISR
jgi:hypothetical protein